MSFSDSGISGDVVDLECLEAGVSDPGAALYLTTGNASLLTPSTESATPAAALFESVWAGCVRAGRWFADSVSDGGGPSLGSSATDCLDRWFDQDDRFARYLSERLDEFNDGLYSCLDVDEYEAFWAWVESV